MLRYAVGLIFVAAGLNGYFVFWGLEPFLPESPEALELLGTGYLLVMEKSVELIGGLLLLWGRFIPLGLAALFPLTINIAAFHLFRDPQLLLPVLGLTAAHLYLLWVIRDRYRPLFVYRL
ncbi:DoxX family membrane protein [Paenibacillus hemerocallicola]|uniref:DoxX family membrane protein n=1 Tax=Paenibacillus hemerocallicola TaxID=1172614 RepID=A0A5C4SYS3_9BACL|nr:DoxX family membrane protein [Paenibacillus hemerocallicola]